MLAGLMEVDHRQGYLGPVAHVEGEEREALAARLAPRLAARRRSEPGDYAVGHRRTAVDDGAAVVARRGGGRPTGVLPIAGMRWARKPNPEQSYPDALISRPSTALHAGRRDRPGAAGGRASELVDARAGGPDREAQTSRSAGPPLHARAGAEAAGGARLDRAVHRLRPRRWWAATTSTPRSSTAPSRPAASPAPPSSRSSTRGPSRSSTTRRPPCSPTRPSSTGTRRRASHGSRRTSATSFKGDVTLRDALVHSMNIPAVKTAAALGVRDQLVADWAATLGLTTPVKRELGSAIGSSCTTLWSLANVYALLDRYGEKRPPRFVKRVLDRDGRLLEDHTAPADPWVPLSTRLAAAAADGAGRAGARDGPAGRAFITVSLMHEVATVGHRRAGGAAREARRRARPGPPTTPSTPGSWASPTTSSPGCGSATTRTRCRSVATRPAAAPPSPSGSPTCRAALRDARPSPTSRCRTGSPSCGSTRRPGRWRPDEHGGVVEPFKVENQPVGPRRPAAEVEVQDLFNQ